MKVYPKTLRELLQFPVERTEINCSVFLDERTDWFPQNAGTFFRTFSEHDCDADGGLVTKYLKDVDIDGTRVWVLAFVELHGKPVFMFYKYGRGGRDGYGIQFIGETARSEVEKYLNKFTVFDECFGDTILELDQPIGEEFTKFYGHDILSDFGGI